MPRVSLDRRRFLKTGLGSLTVGLHSTGCRPLSNRPAANERITVGVIGLGSRGFNLLDDFLSLPDVQITALCDVHDLHYREREWGKGTAYGRQPALNKVEAGYAEQAKSGSFYGVRVFSDPRELLALTDVDAIVIATPDHWHAWCTLEALRQGKDVYCEKPVTHFFREGQLVYREVAARKAVFQTGSQQRSDALFRRAVEIVRNGHLGTIREIAVGLEPGYDAPLNDTTTVSPPQGLDYNLWCGPAPDLPYMRARHHRWWRGHRAFGGGVLMDWIGHHNDIAHWSLEMDRSGPEKVEAVTWIFPETDVYNTPVHYTIRCEYPGGIVSTISDSNRNGTKWIGADGWLHVTRGKMTASDPSWLEESFNAGSIQVERSPGHARNFVYCIKSRKECISPAEVAHRSITPGHLGYVSNTLARPLKWDAVTESIVNDSEADKLLQAMSYRAPWSLS